jgi:hypothetical protein
VSRQVYLGNILAWLDRYKKKICNNLKAFMVFTSSFEENNLLDAVNLKTIVFDIVDQRAPADSC